MTGCGQEYDHTSLGIKKSKAHFEKLLKHYIFDFNQIRDHCIWIELRGHSGRKGQSLQLFSSSNQVLFKYTSMYT